MPKKFLIFISLAFICSCSSNGGNEEPQQPSSSSVAETPSSSSLVQNSSSSGVQSSSSSSSGAIVGETFTDPRDGQVYRIVTIGTQTWMAENLNYSVEGSFCNRNLQVNCDKYGRLYDWATAMALDTSCYDIDCSELISEKHKGICPDGWHVSTLQEWNILQDYVGEGSKLRATYDWKKTNSNALGDSTIKDTLIQGTDDYGFTALPGGEGNPSWSRWETGQTTGTWWTATGAILTSVVLMDSRKANFITLNSGKSFGVLSVRCVLGAQKFLTVTFNTDGGIPAIPSVSVDSGSALRLKYPADPTKNGYTFGGWFDGDKLYISSTKITEDVTLVAKWNKLGDGGILIDSRDGQSYNTVLIGGNRWMAENLNYATDSSWCYDDDKSNCETYGRLYAWDIAMSIACPSGWRLPNDNDWRSLISVVGNEDYGFSAVFGGYRNPKNETFHDIGSSGLWLSATTTTWQTMPVFPDTKPGKEYEVPNIWQMNSEANELSLKNFEYNASVRCVED
ncbi:MAG: InlB B-repeat-containing protein [Fibromonadales bacterium]|nr:InlB B-repeat-containing protein [Fibromonadales bacterium]